MNVKARVEAPGLWARTIDVVILDGNMPEMNGIETLRVIKKKWPLVEVIFLTAHSTIDIAVRAIKLGAFHYLVKPADMSRLVLKIGQAAQRKRQREISILDVYMTPYITLKNRKRKIRQILGTGRYPENRASEEHLSKPVVPILTHFTCGFAAFIHFFGDIAP